jgi:hypothetical protein
MLLSGFLKRKIPLMNAGGFMCISDLHCSDIRSDLMVQLNGMQGMIAGYIASPKGQEAIRNYLSSPEGQKTMDTYLSTPDGQEMAKLILSRALEGTNLSTEVRAQVLAAVAEKKKPSC